MAQIEELIQKYMADNILFSKNGFPYPDDVSFLENGIIDSMNVLELVVFVEDNFGITVDDKEVVPENFDSVERLAAYIRQKEASRIKP